jgi:hypothetical protein
MTKLIHSDRKVVATRRGVYAGMGLWIGCNWLQLEFSFADATSKRDGLAGLILSPGVVMVGKLLIEPINKYTGSKL